MDLERCCVALEICINISGSGFTHKLLWPARRFVLGQSGSTLVADLGIHMGNPLNAVMDGFWSSAVNAGVAV